MGTLSKRSRQVQDNSSDSEEDNYDETEKLASSEREEVDKLVEEGKEGEEEEEHSYDETEKLASSEGKEEEELVEDAEEDHKEGDGYGPEDDEMAELEKEYMGLRHREQLYLKRTHPLSKLPMVILHKPPWRQMFLRAANLKKIGSVKVKFCKPHKGSLRGIAHGRSQEICFGKYALQAIQPARISSRQVEAEQFHVLCIAVEKSGCVYFQTNQLQQSQHKLVWVREKEPLNILWHTSNRVKYFMKWVE